MDYSITLSGKAGTHLASLITAVNKTNGDILEMGVGIFSTPYLHYQSFLSKRNLTSFDNHQEWIDTFATSEVCDHLYQGKYHKLIYVSNWDEAEIEKPWDVALIDHAPAKRRAVDIKRLVNFAKYIVIHDSNPEEDRDYRYTQIYPLFKYKTIWDNETNSATVLSNFVDLSDFWQ